MKAIRFLLPFLTILLAVQAHSLPNQHQLRMHRMSPPGNQTGDSPIRGGSGRVRADTTWYGDYQVVGGEYLARASGVKRDVMWTFDRGNGPHGDPRRIEDGEGWRGLDLTTNPTTWFRVIGADLDLGPGVRPPIISGARSLWVGVDRVQSDTLCYMCGPGYGDGWGQQALSEPLAYDGSGSVTLQFEYFNKSEPCYDGTQVYLVLQDGDRRLLNPVPPGTCTSNPIWNDIGGFTDSIGSYSSPATYTRVITAVEIGAAQTIRIMIEFTSDGGYSDEDCEYPTIWGPFGVDDITIDGGGIAKSYDFEDGLQGWTAQPSPGIGNFAKVVDVGCYTVLDPCNCGLVGNVIAMHAGECDGGSHPPYQHTWVESPICDLGGSSPKTIFMDVDLYADLQNDDDVVFRWGWRYYPWECPSSGVVEWSPRVGNDVWSPWEPTCGTYRFGAYPEVPETAEKVTAILEIIRPCDVFPCQGPANFSPLFDNIAVGTTPAVHAPAIQAELGCTFQDVGSWPSNLFDPKAVGPANTSLDKYMDQPGKPDLAGDSLVVAGPQPGSDPNKRWEARMWWRVAKRAPFQRETSGGVSSTYKIWRDRVADGRAIDRPDHPDFTYGWMDSVENGSMPLRNKFQSTFREDDDDFVGEGVPENEMLWDNVFYPGTRIEYFTTSNYHVTPNELYYYPDTTGSYFLEFEILPGLRLANVPGCGGPGQDVCVFQPATLYIDAYNAGAQFFIENALRHVLNGDPPCGEEPGCPIPPDRNWDRYDYENAASNFNVAFSRSYVAGSNNGMTLNQILGYRTILLSAGTYGAGTMEDPDFALFDSWLSSPLCDANVDRQVFVMNGDRSGEVAEYWPSGALFLNNRLGAALLCDSFNGRSEDPACLPENDSYCVRLAPAGDLIPFGIGDVDVFGNWDSQKCEGSAFNVLAPVGNGMPNLVYSAEDPPKVGYYAEIVHQDLGSQANYRVVIDGYSLHRMTMRNAGGVGDERCPRANPSIFEAIGSELEPALGWGFGPGGTVPLFTSVEEMATCEGTWVGDVEGDGGGPAVDRLYRNFPNPFNPRTTLKFSLARTGSIQLRIYNVNGQLVRSLIDGRMEAGPHEAVWDGTNDRGVHVGSGVYWAQMRTATFESNRKMVILK